MNRYTVAVLVKNQFGVLNRVTSMFRRRQFNISALTVSETESADLSRITVLFDGDEILAAAQGFDARTVDYSKESIIFQLTADTRRIDDFVNLMKDYKILEICRTGIVSLERGSSTIRKVTNY